MKIRRTIESVLETKQDVLEGANVPEDITKRFVTMPRLQRVVLETMHAKITYEQVYE